ncbi:MAG: hypothetical protein Q4A78_07985 [Peptostreptococcaceae bacterium]|nr:hypothetical protein [Peptostreptococcaceae bacterium]
MKKPRKHERLQRHLLLIILLLICAQPLIGDASEKKPASSASDSIVYQNREWGFSLALPRSWEGKYTILKSEYGDYEIRHKQTHENESGGLICSIERRIGEHLTQSNLDQSPYLQKILHTANGWTFIVSYPGDVQASMANETWRKEYAAMSQDWDTIAKSFRLTGKERPKAGKKDYQIVGTDYFTAEIPGSWKIKLSSSPAPVWNLYHKDLPIGNIVLASYHRPIAEVPEGNVRTSVRNDNLQRRAEITLDMSKVKNFEEVLNRMHETFSLDYGAYCIADFDTEVDAALLSGAGKIFGQITKVSVQGDEISSITIQEKTAGASGKEIINKGKPKTYKVPAQSPPRIAALAAPAYKIPEMYDFPSLYAFHYKKQEKKILSAHYDFVIRNGMITHMIERPLP